MADPNERSQLNASSLTDSKQALAKLFNSLLNVTVFNNSGDILVNMHNILSNVVWYRTISWFYLGISIASICVGGLYIDMCTVEYMIPIYLIVAGSVGVATNLLFMCKWATGYWAIWTQCKDQNESCRSFWFSWTLWILFWFNLAWFIAGSVWIFGVHTQYRHNYDYEPDTHLYVVRHMYHGHYLHHRGEFHGKRGEVVAAGGNAHMNAHLDNAVDDDMVADAGRMAVDGADGNDAKLAVVAAAARDSAKLDAAEEDEDLEFDAQVVARDQEAGKEVFADGGGGVDFAAMSGSRARRRKGMPVKPYCHRGLYEYAFWVTVAHYVMLLLDLMVFMMLSCCYCCAYLVVPYTSSIQPATA